MAEKALADKAALIAKIIDVRFFVIRISIIIIIIIMIAASIHCGYGPWVCKEYRKERFLNFIVVHDTSIVIIIFKSGRCRRRCCRGCGCGCGASGPVYNRIVRENIRTGGDVVKGGSYNTGEEKGERTVDKVLFFGETMVHFIVIIIDDIVTFYYIYIFRKRRRK